MRAAGDGNWTPAQPPVALVDAAVHAIRECHPEAVERPDFLNGLLFGLALVNTAILRVFDEQSPDPTQGSVLNAVSQSLGTNHELYRAARDFLHPAADVVLPETDGGA